MRKATNNMEWVLVAGYVALSVATLVIVARDQQARSELTELRERVVKLEQAVAVSKKPVKRTHKPAAQHRQVSGVWRYSGKGW